eukprot:TRINITY_DN10354_c0_g1_i1.p1 TRINITY_DN10354_c0_g1~~TRINITY_DN10354_c0_g1_i1.p1  ORF type:complete len:926 (+),score=194.66 TRINITY_DN10354_c0_g1_i1:62-2839(+)
MRDSMYSRDAASSDSQSTSSEKRRTLMISFDRHDIDDTVGNTDPVYSKSFGTPKKRSKSREKKKAMKRGSESTTSTATSSSRSSARGTDAKSARTESESGTKGGPGGGGYGGSLNARFRTSPYKRRPKRRSGMRPNVIAKSKAYLGVSSADLGTLESVSTDVSNSYESLSINLNFLDEMDFIKKSVQLYDMERRLLDQRRQLLLYKIEDVINNASYDEEEDVAQWAELLLPIIRAPLLGNIPTDDFFGYDVEGRDEDIEEWLELSNQVKKSLKEDNLVLKKNTRRHSFDFSFEQPNSKPVLERSNSDRNLKQVKVKVDLPSHKRTLKTKMINIIDKHKDPFKLSSRSLVKLTEIDEKADNLEIYDDNDDLKAIYLRELIIRMITDFDEDLVNDFLFTVEYYIDSVHLLKTLIVFYLSPKKDYSKKEKVNENICEILLKWISVQYKGLTSNKVWSELLGRFIDYLEEQKKKKDNKYSSKLKMALQEYDYKFEFVYEHILKTQPNDQKKLNLALLDISPEDLAQQLTLREQQYFREIRLTEFYFTRWSGQWGRFERQAPNLTTLIQRYNDIGYWIATTILATPNITGKERADIITYWINVMNELYKINNFNTASQVCSSLNMQIVKGLSKSWANISRSTSDLFDELNLVLSPIVSAYRKHIETIEPDVPMIPRLDVILRDLTLIEEDYDVNKEGMINIAKMSLISRTLRNFLRHGTLYKFSEDEDIQQLLFHRYSMTESELDSCYKALKNNKEKSEFYNIGMEIFPTQKRLVRTASQEHIVSRSLASVKKSKKIKRKKGLKSKKSLELKRPDSFNELKENSKYYNEFLEYLKNNQSEDYLYFYYDIMKLEGEIDQANIRKNSQRIASRYLGTEIQNAKISLMPGLKNKLLEKLADEKDLPNTLFQGIKHDIQDTLSERYQYYKLENE